MRSFHLFIYLFVHELVACEWKKLFETEILDFLFPALM